MKNGSFIKTKEEVNNFLRVLSAPSGNTSEGLIVAWETDQRVLEKLVPKPLKVVAPWVMVQVDNIPITGYSEGYVEGLLIVPVMYRDKPMSYMVSLLLSPSGGEMPMHLGRDLNSYPKKMADDIKLYKNGDCSGFPIKRHGIEIITVETEKGNFNNEDANNLFGGYEIGKETTNTPVTLKYNLETINNSVQFTNVRFMASTVKSVSTSVEKAKITKLILRPSLDDPWAELPIVKPLGAVYSIGSSIEYPPKTLLRVSPEKYAKYLFSRWDASVVGYEKKNFG